MKLPRLTFSLFLLLTLVTAAKGETAAPANLRLTQAAGLEITGTTGRLYTVEYSTNLNLSAEWKPLTNFILATSPFVVPGTIPTTGAACCYRTRSAPIPSGSSNLVLIPAGSFLFGSPASEADRYDDEGPQTSVTFSYSFWIGKYPVTQGEYVSIMTNNPSYFTGDLSRPVEQVSWFDATNYCRQLTLRERAAGRISAELEYRLPTEAEWEYACRAGTWSRFYYGRDISYLDLASHAWYIGNSGGQTHPVGQMPPNPWGLFDMCGNVWEWCQDWYAPSHPGGSVTDPQGPASGSIRVLRGGSYAQYGWLCRSAARIGDDPAADYYDDYGFRVVLAPAAP